MDLGIVQGDSAAFVILYVRYNVLEGQLEQDWVDLSCFFPDRHTRNLRETWRKAK